MNTASKVVNTVKNVASTVTNAAKSAYNIAYDGNVGFGDNTSILGKLFSALGMNLYPRQSTSQDSFKDLVELSENGDLRDPQGRIIYYPDGTFEVKGW